MQKIIIVSLHKNGTTSISSYFIELGYSCFQYDFDHQFRDSSEKKLKMNIIDYIKAVESRYEVLSDIPVNIMYQYFDIKHPDAKFILVKREIDDWIRSARNNYYKYEKSLSKYKTVPFYKIDRIQYEKYISNLPKSIDLCTDEQLKTMYNLHIKNIQEYFQGKENKLLILDLEDPQKNNKINQFLGIKSNLEFPWKNKTAH